MIKEFKKFILRGSLVDLAIGFTVGASFSTFVKSLVNDILMPPVSLILGSNNFANFFIVLKNGASQGLKSAHIALQLSLIVQQDVKLVHLS
jgi:large conductance mechanosensitive channel